MNLFNPQVIGGDHAGKKAHAQVGGDQAGYGIGIVPFEDDFRMNAGEAAELVCQDAQAVGGLHGDERIFFNIF